MGEQDGLLLHYFYHNLVVSIPLVRLFQFPVMVDCGLWEVLKRVRKGMWGTDELMKGEECAEEQFHKWWNFGPLCGYVSSDA